MDYRGRAEGCIGGAMSTKSTIAHGENFHFYHEIFEEDVLYLTLQGVEFTAQPSDAATVAARGREVADLLLRGLQEGVLAEQEQERRQERAMWGLKTLA